MKTIKKQTVLVTGASGMLGSRICTTLSCKGFNVLAAYHSNEEFIPNADNVKKIYLDITKKLRSADLQRVDSIIHCAAVTDVNFCELNKKICREVNIIGTRSLVELAKFCRAKFIYISTPMVFSGEKGGYKEEDNINPLNYYAKTKAQAEKIVLRYKQGLVLRVNPIGKRPLGAHPSFMQWFVDMAVHNRSFSLFTDVNINPISTGSLSEVLSTVLENFSPGILHLGSKKQVNKSDIWKEVLNFFPNYSGVTTKLSVNKTHAGKVASRPHEMWLNVDKARGLGYKLPQWKQEIRRVMREILT